MQMVFGRQEKSEKADILKIMFAAHFMDSMERMQYYVQQAIIIVFIEPCSYIIKPRCEKTGLRGFRPGPTQTGLYSHKRWLEA